MKTRFRTVILACSVLYLGACSSSNLMRESPSPEIDSPAANKAVVVFMRTSFVAGAIGVELFEIENGELKFVGALPMGSKIAHVTNPGEKVYMAYGTAADFMIADVEKGKTYYSIVRPNWGTGGFAPTPVKIDGTTPYNTGSDDFKNWVSDTKLLEKNSNASDWFHKNKGKYLEIYKRYWERFSAKTAEQKQQRMLLPSDGM